ncbi:hypothetical protein LLH00_04510 [bacterium]|nr:hypothetical protein [bacterium]
MNEVDYTLSYDFSIKPLSCTVGGMHYTYPKTGEISSTELFLAVGLDAFMQPTVSINQDIDEAKGSYVSFSLGNELPVDFLKTQIEYSATVGWGSSNHNGYYYEVEKNAFADAGFSLEIPFTLRQWLTVTPVFSWSSLIDGQVRKSQSFDDHLFFGATLSCDL